MARSIGIKSIVMLSVAAAFSISALLTVPASAQTPPKKISYAEAFKRCKAFIDKEKGGLANSTTNELTRTSRGAACMQKFGHRL
jgi:hypothetical protein